MRRELDVPLRWVDDMLCALLKCVLELYALIVNNRFSKLR